MRKNVISNDHTRSAHNVLFISALSLWSMGDKKGAPSLWKTITGYAERGWEVYFLTGNKIKGELPDLPKGMHFIYFDLPFLKSLMKIKKIGFFAKALWWLCFQIVAFLKVQRLHTNHRIDLVYGYEIFGVPVAKILSKLWGVPVVSRFQGSILRLVWMKEPLWKLRAWEHVVAYRISSFSDLVIMTNDGSQGDKLLAQMGVQENKVKFWLNGIDKQQFINTSNRERLKQKLKIEYNYVILSVSRLIKLKRVDRSIHALHGVVKQLPDTILLVVGDGPERVRLESLVYNLGLEKNVRFEGAVAHNQIPHYFALADIFLSFYDWSNVGNPLLEAMVTGKCIVTLNNGDTGQFVKNGYNGILLEYSELDTIPDVIKRLLLDKDLRNQFGENAKRYAEKNFWTWQERLDTEVNEALKLIKDI